MLISNKTAEWMKVTAPATHKLFFEGATVSCVVKIALTIITLGVPAVVALTYDGALAIKHSITPAPKKLENPKKASKPRQKKELEIDEKIKDYASKAAGYAGLAGRAAYSGGQYFWNLSTSTKVAAIVGGSILINRTIGVKNFYSLGSGVFGLASKWVIFPLGSLFLREGGNAIINAPGPLDLTVDAFKFIFGNIGPLSKGIFTTSLVILKMKLLQTALKVPYSALMKLKNNGLNTLLAVNNNLDKWSFNSILSSESNRNPHASQLKNELKNLNDQCKRNGGSLLKERIIAKQNELKKLDSLEPFRKDLCQNINYLLESTIDDRAEKALADQLFKLKWIYERCGMSENSYKEEVNNFLTNEDFYREQGSVVDLVEQAAKNAKDARNNQGGTKILAIKQINEDLGIKVGLRVEPEVRVEEAFNQILPDLFVGLVSAAVTTATTFFSTNFDWSRSGYLGAIVFAVAGISSRRINNRPPILEPVAREITNFVLRNDKIARIFRFFKTNEHHLKVAAMPSIVTATSAYFTSGAAKSLIAGVVTLPLVFCASYCSGSGLSDGDNNDPVSAALSPSPARPSFLLSGSRQPNIPTFSRRLSMSDLTSIQKAQLMHSGDLDASSLSQFPQRRSLKSESGATIEELPNQE